MICRGLFALVIVPAAALLTKAQPVACTECIRSRVKNMRRPLVPNRVWRLAAAFTLAGITVAQNAGRSSGPGSQTQKQAPENLRTGLGISVASDEVLRVAVQLGVCDVVIYGGPGSGKVPGTDRKRTSREPTIRIIWSYGSVTKVMVCDWPQSKVASFIWRSITTLSSVDPGETNN